ncbi:MAG: ATP-binding cassette domain-containing protein [Alphaproteobacteria bacterium]|nr:MAG: ATP-binding cassette domain-containing protein [Alphaproteobacteria bacterium]
MPPILALRNASVRFGEKPLFSGVDIGIQPGDRICLVGRNGTGKTTLLKALAGTQDLDEGHRFIQPGTRIAYLRQEPVVPPGQTVAAFIEDGLDDDERDLRQYRVRDLLGILGLDGDAITTTLSGGGLRRAALGQTFVGDPDIVLLDEPTNHLDIATVEWLEGFLRQNQAAMLMISHDRAFLRQMSNKTLWLEHGQMRLSNRGYEHFDEWSEKVREAELVARSKLEKRIAEENSWLQTGVTARRKRNQGRLRNLYKMREQRAKQINTLSAPKIDWDEGPPASRKVIETRAISKAFGDNVIVEEFSTRIMRGDRIGLVGPNGAGKTTLVRLLTGELAPDTGRVKIGNSVEMVYFDQNRETLNPKFTLWETLVDKENGGGGDSVLVQGRVRHVVAYLKDFLFDEKQARQPVGTLSGGERNRLLLAKALTKRSNLLILDEPTNDLDMDTLDMLEDLLTNYDGTLILISHDRDFLDRLVTSVISFDPDGKVREYAGGYSDMILQRGDRFASNDVEAIAVKAAKTERASKAKANRKPTKMTYKDQRLLQILPDEIDDLESLVQDLEAKIGDSGFHGNAVDKITTLAEQLEAAKQDIDTKQDQWLMLEDQREQLEEAKS